MEESLKVVLLQSFILQMSVGTDCPKFPAALLRRFRVINSNHTDNFHNFSFIRILNSTEATSRLER